MAFKIVRNDITKMNTEAIVSMANDHPTDKLMKAVVATRNSQTFYLEGDGIIRTFLK